MATGCQGEQVEPVDASRLNAGKIAEGAVDALGLLVNHERAAAHHVAAVPHLPLSGADLLGILDLSGIIKGIRKPSKVKADGRGSRSQT